MPLRTDFQDNEPGHTARSNETNAKVNEVESRTDRLKVMQMFQSGVTGGGSVTLSGGAIGWSARLMVISMGTGPHVNTDGFFEINMPPNGTVIPAVGAGSDATVTGGRIPLGPLNFWPALFYIVPFGNPATSVPGNFRIARFAGPTFQVPDSWLLLGNFNNDNQTFKFATGQIINPT